MDLIEKINEFNKAKILVIGDIMLDRYIFGEVDRISPEAPVPVVDVRKEIFLPGGAANVAANITSLGGKAFLFGVIGNDDSGKKLLKILDGKVERKFIKKINSRPTTLKTRIIAHNQQIVRFDIERREPLEFTEEVLEIVKKIINKINGIIISDYGKGVITQDLMKNLTRTFRELIITVDPKVEHFHYYRNVTSITPNLQEAIGGANVFFAAPNWDIKKIGKQILKKLNCKSLLITEGPHGMHLFTKDKIYHVPACAKEVYDVTGAGDTVIAAFTVALAIGADFLSAAKISNFAAGVAVSKLGTATVTRQEIKEMIRGS